MIGGRKRTRFQFHLVDRTHTPGPEILYDGVLEKDIIGCCGIRTVLLAVVHFDKIRINRRFTLLLFLVHVVDACLSVTERLAAHFDSVCLFRSVLFCSVLFCSVVVVAVLLCVFACVSRESKRGDCVVLVIRTRITND